jgi:hypothetical protein
MTMSERCWADEQKIAEECVTKRIEEMAARFGIVKLVETNRWWQLFCAAWPAAGTSKAAADLADAAIAEAKKRGRL